MPYDTCGDNGMYNIPSEEMIKSGINANQCMKYKNLTVAGSYYSSIYKVNRIVVSECNNATFIPNNRS